MLVCEYITMVGALWDFEDTDLGCSHCRILYWRLFGDSGRFQGGKVVCDNVWVFTGGYRGSGYWVPENDGG